MLSRRCLDMCVDSFLGPFFLCFFPVIGELTDFFLQIPGSVTYAYVFVLGQFSLLPSPGVVNLLQDTATLFGKTAGRSQSTGQVELWGNFQVFPQLR